MGMSWIELSWIWVSCKDELAGMTRSLGLNAKNLVHNSLAKAGFDSHVFTDVCTTIRCNQNISGNLSECN